MLTAKNGKKKNFRGVFGKAMGINVFSCCKKLYDLLSLMAKKTSSYVVRGDFLSSCGAREMISGYFKVAF